MSSPKSTRPTVAELADEFVARYRKGERPPLSEYADRYPEYAEEILEIFPGLAMIEDFAPHESESQTDSFDHAAGTDPAPTQLGDFRIIREVGRGGMGIVYEAEQESLTRRVALKVLTKQMLLDPMQKIRFLREAKAAAQLHHTNIVPVFGVGEHMGLQYYAMQFIHGLGLDEVLDELKQMRSDQLPVTVDAQAATAKREGRVGQGVSAVSAAQSLMTGQFAPTLLLIEENSDQNSEFRGQDGEVVAGKSGLYRTAAPDLNQENSKLRPSRSEIKDTATLRMSDTFSLSGSVNLPGAIGW